MLSVKRVMPQLKFLALNLNRLTGALPEWIRWHPSLDWWDPFTLLFNQEGKDELGNLAGFSNTPANLNYFIRSIRKRNWPTPPATIPNPAPTREPRDNNDPTP